MRATYRVPPREGSEAIDIEWLLVPRRRRGVLDRVMQYLGRATLSIYAEYSAEYALLKEASQSDELTRPRSRL
jgi:hypothetical protein